jgi:hypothetical protein
MSPRLTRFSVTRDTVENLVNLGDVLLTLSTVSRVTENLVKSLVNPGDVLLT